MHDKETYLAAIERAGGVIEGIAKILGIHRGTVWRHRKEFPWIDDAIKEQESVCIDLARMNVRKQLEEGDAQMSRWYLDRKAEDFRQHLKVEATVEHRARIVLMLPANNRQPLLECEKNG